mmetsp:Transcript_59817/g.159214  ORF Transcript_59817/g.159214 Transcript_59817/m.159214 type:complete len:213 (+) Transcript_59817:1689-2327(+)
MDLASQRSLSSCSTRTILEERTSVGGQRRCAACRYPSPHSCLCNGAPQAHQWHQILVLCRSLAPRPSLARRYQPNQRRLMGRCPRARHPRCCCSFFGALLRVRHPNQKLQRLRVRRLLFQPSPCRVPPIASRVVWPRSSLDALCLCKQRSRLHPTWRFCLCQHSPVRDRSTQPRWPLTEYLLNPSPEVRTRRDVLEARSWPRHGPSRLLTLP